MNYLGHAVFSGKNDAEMLGNLAGDFLKNQYHHLLDKEVLQGVKLHRQIDVITDDNPYFKEMVVPLRASFGKYSGVVLDVLLDHVIASEWGQLFEVKFDAFTGSVYSGVLSECDRLPNWQSEIIERMARSSWLDAYRSEEGLRRVFHRLSQKASRNLDGGEVLELYKRERDTYRENLPRFLDYNQKKILKTRLLISPRIEWKN
ncbi:MAG: DUF479 domain-containing protein [Saprospirales bacterium]|nr:MAG: DUF479 domain-containing protein [Saprospirales bacterium]